MNEICRKIGNAGIICGGALIMSSIVAMPVANCFNPYRNDEKVLRYREVEEGLTRMREGVKSKDYFREGIVNARCELSLLESSESVGSYRTWASNVGTAGLGAMAAGAASVLASMAFMIGYAGHRTLVERREKKVKCTGN